MGFKDAVAFRYQIVAGDLLPFRKKDGSPVEFKRKQDAEKLLNVPAGDAADILKHVLENKENIKWIEPDILTKLVKRLQDMPKALAILKKIAIEGHHSPYYGQDSHQLAWRNPSSDSHVSFPLPAKVGDLDGVLGRDVPIGHSDPFMWMDTKYKVTKKLLWANNQKPLQIHTRSDLIAHDDYINAINPSKHVVNIHVISLNDDFNRMAEPGAPSARRRLQAADKLADNGIKVYIVHDRFESSKLSSSAKWVNEVTRSGVARIVTLKNMKSFLKENIVKLSDTQAEAMNVMADQAMAKKERASR